MSSSAALLRAPTRILYEDSALLVVDKPAGLLTHPNPDGKGQAAFRGRFDAKKRRFHVGSEHLWILHRLDRETSGLILAARSEESYQALRRAFEAGKVRKLYQALLTRAPRGKPRWEDHLVTARGGGGAKTQVLRDRPANAALLVKSLRVLRPEGLALVRVDLLTGRTHQIRVQAAARSLPVAGDDIYGDFATNKALRKGRGLRRLFLHASRLEFPHPETGKQIEVDSPLPPDLGAVLDATPKETVRRSPRTRTRHRRS